MDWPEKRPHVVTGNTPNKPREKRARDGNASETCDQRPARRTLAFQGKGSPLQQASRRLLQRARLVRSPKSPKQLISPPKRKTVAVSWEKSEVVALVQFIALHSELKAGEWPTFGAQHEYWDKAAEFIQETVGTSHKRSKASIRRHVLIVLKKKFNSVDDAEAALGITLESYIDGSPDASTSTTTTSTFEDELKLSPSLAGKLSALTPNQLIDLIFEGLALLKPHVDLAQLFVKFLDQVCVDALCTLEDLYAWLAKKMEVSSSVHGFIQLSLQAMKRLEVNGKSNLVIKFCQCLANDRPDKSGSLMPMHRMPFGLIQHCIEFFTCTNVMQIKEPEDFRLWHETMLTEFPERFQRLLAGPMWSGLDPQDQKDPMKARVNVPCTSKSTQQRRNKKSLFTSSTDAQVAAFEELKEVNPDGRYWLKLDATDVKEALMESMKGVWNGDEDLGDGKLQELRRQYDERVNLVGGLQSCANCVDLELGLRTCLDQLGEDVLFLDDGFKNAVEQYRKKYTNPSTAEEVLKSSNWNVVEFQTLLQQAQLLKQAYEAELNNLHPGPVTPDVFRHVKGFLRALTSDVKTYLRNLFKKMRTAATHVLVLMLSDERRQKKPYALPVRYIPYRSLRDQYVRDFTKDVKQHMTQRGMTIVGTTTDGEFCSLRSRGETRALHIWQIIHDVKDSVRRKSKATLLKMLIATNFAPDGSPIVEVPNRDIPESVILELHHLQAGGLSLEDSITNIRGSLVPPGYSPYPFRANTEESLLDKLRSIVATYTYRKRVQEFKEQGVDFSTHLYVPEVDPVTGLVHHERSDHNHLLKRIANHLREGGYDTLQYEAFSDVLADPLSGLTHAALVGKRKQSVKDAERLLSYHVVASLDRHGHNTEADYVRIIAQWHEASDGRGLSQLQRCRYNYEMLNFILDEWMPWHTDTYNFATIDINRPVAGIRGFSRETVVEVTTNIESQELRRTQNLDIGYEEHPRAAETDDLESYFCIAHRDLGQIFTLKMFKSYWPKSVREFCKRMDPDLPFYYWTLNERYSEEAYPSFDVRPAFDDYEDGDDRNHPLRLHRLRLNQREDSSIFVVGRAHLPARHRQTIRQSFHRPGNYLAPPP